MTEFKLDVLIKLNNEKNGKNRKMINVNKTWGLEYLSPAGQKVLNTIAAGFSAIRSNQPYRASVPTVRNRYQIAQALKESLSSKDFLAQAKQVCKEEMNVTFKNKLQLWEKEQVFWLSNNKHWDSLFAANPEAKESLQELKQFWSRQQRFALASNEYLLKAIDLLTELGEPLFLAEEEFRKKRKKLPKFVTNRYGTFLVKLRKEYNDIKRDLLSTMYCRLYVAAESYSKSGNFYNDDVIVYCINKLKDFGVIKKTMSIQGLWTTLQPDQFNRFHDVIQRRGSQKLRNELSQLPWFTEPHGRIDTSPIFIGKVRYLCPLELVPFIPKTRRPEWLFQNDRTIRFLQSKQSIIATLKLCYTSVTPFDTAERFARLDMYESKIKEEMTKTKEGKISAWQLWSYFGYRRLLVQWNSLLQKREDFCIEERIRLLEQIAHSELPPPDKDNKYKFWLLVRQQLNKFPQFSQFPHTKVSLSHQQEKRLGAVESFLKKQLEQEADNFTICLLRSLASGEGINEDENDYLLKILEGYDLRYDKSKVDEIKPYFSKALAGLLRQTQEYCQQQTTSLTSPIIVNNLSLASRLSANDQEAIKQLQCTLRKIVYSQSEWLKTECYSEASQRLLAIQRLVNQFSDNDLKNWMTNMPPNIKEENWKKFLNRWSINLKNLSVLSDDLLEEPISSDNLVNLAKSTVSVPPVVRNTSNLTSSINHWFFQITPVRDKSLSTFAPEMVRSSSAEHVLSSS